MGLLAFPRAIMLLACVLTGCNSTRERTPTPSFDAAMPGPASRPELCSRPGADAVRDVFCNDARPVISSLAELQRQLGITPDQASGVVGTVGVLLGHSTALAGRLVSPINPRAILPSPRDYTVMAFQRGAQRVELASMGRDDGLLNFYLITFRQACNASELGCLAGDLYTLRIEAEWIDIDLQDDEDLKNTPSDCRQCHQRGRDAPVLLMRELEAPWTHFFASEIEADTAPGVNGGDLALDYRRAKGDEPYAGIPAAEIVRTTGYALQFLVQSLQPVLFDAPTIKDERWLYGPDGWPQTPQRSPTWDRAYRAFKRGEHLALPYFDTRATDLDKQTKLTEAYRRYLAGGLNADELPDLAQIFPDEPQVRAEIGLQTEPNATAAELLIQACGSCHNDVLDQSLSRARFNISLAGMDRAELDLALERVARPSQQPGAMPPEGARQLDAAGRMRLIESLRQAEFTVADRALLSRAALLGMAGEVQR